MKVTKLAHFNDRAEGTCCGLPYNTELAGPRGVHVHFWMGDQHDDMGQLTIAAKAIRRARDVVSISWSPGQPLGFWARNNVEQED